MIIIMFALVLGLAGLSWMNWVPSWLLALFIWGGVFITGLGVVGTLVNIVNIKKLF
jgi:hypothetical protein